MALRLVSGECAECEGTGRDVDRFSPPHTDYFGMNKDFIWYEIFDSRRSDGRWFTAEVCRVCKGSGKVSALVTPSGHIVSIWAGL